MSQRPRAPQQRLAYEFGSFSVDPGERLLLRDGRVLPVTPKAFDLLVHLIERHGRLVDKATLMTELWPDATVEEGNLSFQVSVLRKLLDEGEGQSPIQTVPTKGYRFVAPVRTVEPIRSNAWLSLPRLGIALLFVAGLIALAIWGFGTSRTTDTGAPMRFVPLTTLRGEELAPALAPDGRTVAFLWNQGMGDTFHVYVQEVGSTEVRRLSADPAPDGMPAWSPDGRRIAFVRGGTEGGRIHVVTLVDGSDRVVSDFPAVTAQSGIDWSPDGRYLAVLGAQHPDQRYNYHARNDGIFLVPIDGGEPRQVTRPSESEAHLVPAFSPDGRSIAFVSRTGYECDVYVIGLTAKHRPADVPRRLTWQAAWSISKITWTSDSSAVIYDLFATPSLQSLWKVSVNGATQERIETAGHDARAPSASRQGNRLVFARSLNNEDLFQFQPGLPPQSWFASSLGEDSPQFSADGARVVFSSSASGETQEIWIATSDGAGTRQLTHGPGRWQGSPRFSPDGRQVAFDSCCREGHVHVWTIDVDGGKPRQLTVSTGDQNIPIWSADSKYIYFTHDGGNGRDVWRAPAGGGSPERVTTVGTSLVARLSVDGRSILYQPENTHTLMSVPLQGGVPREVRPCVQMGAFSEIGDHLLYYSPCNEDPARESEVRVLDRLTGVERSFGRVEGFLDTVSGLAVSPDQQVMLYSRWVAVGSDLILIENFR